MDKKFTFVPFYFKLLKKKIFNAANVSERVKLYVMLPDHDIITRTIICLSV